MTVRRRQILALIGAFFVGAILDSPRSISETTVLSPLEQTALDAFLDVLLPRDEVSGSAGDLGVPDELREIARLDPHFQRLLALGCRWLDLTGGPPFGALPAAQQSAVVEWMAQSDWNEVPRRFYELVRQVAVELYYSHLESWHGTAIEHPPQPQGYPPPW